MSLSVCSAFPYHPARSVPGDMQNVASGVSTGKETMDTANGEPTVIGGSTPVKNILLWIKK